MATISTAARIAPFAARSTAGRNVPKIVPSRVVRFYSQTGHEAADDQQLEEAQRRSEEELERQAAADAKQDVEVITDRRETGSCRTADSASGGHRTH